MSEPRDDEGATESTEVPPSKVSEPEPDETASDAVPDEGERVEVNE